MRKPAKSINRVQAREVEKKVIPSIKAISQSMHNTNPDAPMNDFHGYEVPSGTFTDGHGIEWQVQVRAVRTKSKFIRKNEVKPIYRKWAIGFKVRLYVVALINNMFK